MNIRTILLLISLFATSACGSGGGGGTDGTITPTMPTTAYLYLSTSGTPPAGSSIYGVTVSVNLPAGVTVANADITATGAASGKGVTVWENDTVTRKVTLSVSGGAFTNTGEFVKIKCTQAPGITAQAANFTLSNKTVTGGTDIGNLGTLGMIDVTVSRYE